MQMNNIDISNITPWIEFGLAVFSGISAFVTWLKSKKIDKDIEYIKKFRDEIIERETIEEITKVREEINKVKAIIRNYTSKSGVTLTIGRNSKSDIENIQKSMTIIKENISIFNEESSNESDKIYKEINELVDVMIYSSLENEALKRTMREADIKLDNFLATLKELKNKKRLNI